MKKIVLFFGLIFSLILNGQKTCGTPQKMEEFFEKNPEMKIYHIELRAFLENPENLKRVSRVNAVITIPIVVHVLYKNATQNISDAQIQSQITILNQDFRKQNADFSSVVPPDIQPFGADLEVVFCLATKDPNGIATNGIVRKSVPENFDFDNNYYKTTGDLSWDTRKYLNIWVGEFTNTTFLGWSYLPDAAGREYDGLAIGYRYFGTIGTVAAPTNKGRTVTHEIGHYLGLYHPWGTSSTDTDTCGSSTNDDGVADTPNTFAAYYGCPTYPDNSKLCPTETRNAMFMNFMDYARDNCMAFFTNGQKVITSNTLAAPRASLLNTNICVNLNVSEIEKIERIKLYPNPSSQFISVSSPMIDVDEIEIFDTTGKLVFSKNKLRTQERIDIKNLSSGLYFVRIYNNRNLLKSDKFLKK